VDELVLLPSPLLGPRVWQDVADVYRGRGTPVRVARFSGRRRTVGTVQADLAAALPKEGTAVVVAHSNAGCYLPAVAASGAVEATVYADAAVPMTPEWARVPPALVEMLSGLTDADGLVAPWSQWWDEEEVAALYPSAAVRREVEAEMARLPLRYFESAVPVPAGWDRRPAAFLAFGDTYAEEAAVIRRLGWPVRSMPGGHLHMLIDPEGVVAAMTGLLTDLGLRLP
jgi:hypothetical protein